MGIRKTAIIVAGGAGTRMNSDIPKQFLVLGGRPLLMHAIEAFELAFPGILLIVALPPLQFPAWRRLCKHYDFELKHLLAEGGETRFHSVKNALAMAGDEGLIAIHDGARPLVPVSLIRTVFEHADRCGNCIPVTPLNESLRFMTGNSNKAVSRHDYRIVQTPQVFRAGMIRKAYRQEYRVKFTDDAMVAEHAGEIIHLIEGDPVNIKVTRPYDMAVAEALLPFHR